MLDRLTNKYDGLDLETLKASEPVSGAPFQDHVDWLCAMGRFRPRINLPWHNDLASDYANHGSADCNGDGL